MKPDEMCRRLPRAEMALARFNARRTGTGEDEDEIEDGTTETFDYLLDRARPTNAYYNRTVARSCEPFATKVLRELPRPVIAIELTPCQLNPDIASALRQLDFRPASQLCYLGVVPARGEAATPDVQRLDPAQVDFFFDLLQLGGVEFPPAKRVRKRSYYCTTRFRAYVARDGAGPVCGWTTMFVEDKVAFLGNSFTLPEFRRRGTHSALLAARLHDAAELGVEVAYTDVEHGSQSHYNCERAGFRILTINTIWTRT